MRYSIEPKDKIYVKAYRFLFFAKNIGTNTTKIAKNIRNKYSQKLLDSAKIYNRCNENCLKKSNSKNNRSNW